MASPAITPGPPAAGATPPAGGPTPTPQPGGGGGNAMQDLAKLAMDSKKIAGDSPETAPMMREVENQVRQATMKLIQQRQATQQATPQI